MSQRGSVAGSGVRAPVLVLVIALAAVATAIACSLWLPSPDAGSTSGGRAPTASDAETVEVELEQRPSSSTRERAVPGASPASIPQASALSPAAGPARRVLVRSTHDVPLAHVDVTDAVKRIGRFALDDGGTFVLAPPTGDVVVSAPGHRSAPLASDGVEVLLEPDCLLTLTAPDLARRVAWFSLHAFLDPGDELYDGVVEVCSAGFTGPDAWSVAVDVDGHRRLFGAMGDVLEARLGLDTLERVECTLVLLSGRRETFALDLPSPDRALTDLVLEVDGARDADGPIDVELWTARPHGDPGHLVADVATAWGRVQTYGADVRLARRLPDGATSIELSGLPVGLPLGASARGTASGAHGRTFFVHDGSRRSIALLRAGVRITGKLIPPAGRPMPATASFAGRHSADGEPLMLGWISEWKDVRLPVSGELLLIAPEEVPPWPGGLFPMPSRLELSIEILGYETVRRELRVDGPAIDLGDIRLERVPAAVVLAPGHGFEPQDLRYGTLSIAGSTAVYGIDGTDGAREGPLELFLTRDEQQRLLTWDVHASGKRPFPWPTEPPTHVIVSAGVGDGIGRAFASTSRGFERVAERAFEVELLAPEGARQVIRFGWTWNGAWDRLGELDPSRGASTRVAFRAPENGAAFWALREGDDGERLVRVPLSSSFTEVLAR